MTIKDWPTQERPREKLLTLGENALSDAELVAIFLRVGVRNKTAMDLARELLCHFGSIRNLLNANRVEFCKIPGLGQTKYAQFKAALEIGKRYLKERLPEKDVIQNSKKTKEYLVAKLRDKKEEVLGVLFLNSQYHVICFEELFKGTINSINIYIREIIKRAFDHNAAALILAHNHPSGITTPSDADKDITNEIKRILNTLDIVLLDHFIVGDGDVLSFAESGFL